MKKVLVWLLGLVALFPSGAFAHIGSPVVVFDGNAGPYPVRVVVRPPDVIPGRAAIDIRFLDTVPRGTKVTVLPVSAALGLKGAPPPDDAVTVPGDPMLRHAELWLMTSGSYSVHVVVAGPTGEGRAIVPVQAVATRQPKMSPALGVVLIFLGALLFAGAITLVVVGARETMLPPGLRPSAVNFRIAVVAGAIAVVAFAFGIYRGKRWWDNEDLWYRTNQLYRPMPLNASVNLEGGERVVHLKLPPNRRDARADPLPLLPDHGKLMHLFMIREPELDAFAHLHPVRTGKQEFAVAVPSLPAGHYRLYSDVTYENGFAPTLTTAVDLPSSSASSEAMAQPAKRVANDPDDSWLPFATEKAGGVRIQKVATEPLRAGEPVALKFSVLDAQGNAADAEPYMGMLGHAAVRKSDGTVFAHLHPLGTVSMAAQMYFQKQAAEVCDTTVPSAPNANPHATAEAKPIAFPYEFPAPGDYRIWVQAKTAGKVVTEMFDLVVAAAK